MIDGGSHVRAGEVFSSEVESVEVEGVEVEGGGRAEPGSGIVLLALQAGCGLRVASRGPIETMWGVMWGAPVILKVADQASRACA